MTKPTRFLSLVFIAVAGCSSSGRSMTPGGGKADAGEGPPDLSTPASTMYMDFPATPIIDPAGNTPVGAPMLFEPAGSGSATGGPCLTEPEMGSLLPQNWLRPRFHFIAPTDQNLFEIRLHAANEINDLVVYTKATTWTMDKTMWTQVAAHLVDQPITVTIRGAVYANNQLTTPPSLGSTGTITVAPVAAPGAIVYWTSSNGTALRGFTIGDEKVQDVLRPTQASTQCIGCHSSTPDGSFVAFSASSDANNGNPSQFAMRSSDGTLAVPSFLGAGAKTLLAREGQEQPVFSKAHWATGDRIGLSMFYTMPQYEIIWTDLESASTTQDTAWGILKRDGDPAYPASEAFSHDGNSIVYTSGKTVTGGVTLSDGDLRIIPYNNRKGGTSTAVTGASDAAYNEFYPTFSPDDAWLAFGRLPTGETSYKNPKTELYVIPTAGGTATRLTANDPPVCGKKTSPGIMNSWPKWAPDATTIGTRTYYWLTFSSTRSEMGNPQLYVTPIVVEGGQVKTYPALYLWNQPANENNHTPAWDNFAIPLQ